MTATMAPPQELRLASYFRRTLEQEDMIEDARQHLAGVEFDTFVATGLSGTCAATVLAYALGKNYLILRKEDDTSTHDGRRAFGVLGERFIFLDDFVSSGETRRRVLRQLTQVIEQERGYDWDYLTGSRTPKPLHETTFVGEYHYSAHMSGYGEFFPAGTTEATWPIRKGY